MKGKYEIPFTKDGNLCDYPDWRVSEWKPNYDFDATISVESFSRGRSAANFDVKDENGKMYNVFMTDFLDMVKHKDFKAGLLTAKFTFCKRGQNYGMKLV